MPLPPVLSSIVGWLRAGYPEGVPERDYVPLFALLASQLTEDQVSSIIEELVGGSDPITAKAIRDAAESTAAGPLADSDVARVKARLAAGGWPLARPEA